jgi:hypothetical protein
MTDPVIERVRARVRLVAAVALLAALGATFSGLTLSALLHPLISAVEMVDQAHR